MNKFLCIVVLMSFVACSSNKVRDKAMGKREAIEDTIKEDKYVGGEPPLWTQEEGISNGILYVVGYAEFGTNKSPYYVRKASIMDAETRLLSDSPADFRIITQNAITGAGMDSSEYYQIQTKLQEVIGITGIKQDRKKSVCKKIIRYGNFDTTTRRGCWSRVHIKVSELKKAYARTLAFKYGADKVNKFQKLMDKELETVDKGSLYNKKKIAGPGVIKKSKIKKDTSELSTKGVATKKQQD